MPHTFSIIIVTYRRDARLVDTLTRIHAVTRHRDDVDLVLVDNNADGIDRSSYLDHAPKARLVVASANLGCASGRNLGIAHARGEILIFIDDDALLLTEDPLGELDRILTDETVGAVAFKSIDDATSSVLPVEFPHTDKSKDVDTAFDTFRFIGVGHAIRSDVLARIGPYRDEYFYGMEEFELSFRILKAGYRIRYEPTLCVRHMKDPSGRLPARETVERHVLNKMRTAWLHVPMPYLLLTLGAWTARGIALGRGRARLHLVVRDFVAWLRNHGSERVPISKEIIARITNSGGSIWR